MRIYSKELILSLCSLPFLPNNRVYPVTSIKKDNITSHSFCYEPEVDVSACRPSNGDICYKVQSKHNFYLFIAL